MTSSGNLQHVSSIRLRVHYTWILAVVLITLGIVTQFSTTYELWQRIVVGGVGAILFFAVVAVREFVIALVSTRKGVRIRSITLFAFGGLHQVDSTTTVPALELLQAVVGLLFNLIAAGAFVGAYFLLQGNGGILVDVLMQWLAFIWFTLALLHIVPAFPLDTGRAVRALLWRLTNGYERATRISSWIGWGAGFLMAAGGIAMLVVAQEWFAGVLLLAVGLILQNAATHARRLARQPLPVPVTNPPPSPTGSPAGPASPGAPQ